MVSNINNPTSTAELKKSFILFADLGTPFESLSDEDAGKLIKAIFQYQNNGAIKELEGAVGMAFMFVKQQLDRSNQHYELICERNRINGAKGGRPKNPTKPKKPSGLSGNPTKPKITLPDPDPDPYPYPYPYPDSDNKDVPLAPVVTPDNGKGGHPYHIVMDGLEELNGNPFSNYAKEGAAAKQLLKKAKTVCPADPEELLKNLILMFAHLKQNSRQDYWTEVPLTPAQLNSRFDQVNEAFRKRNGDFEGAKATEKFVEEIIF